MYKYLVRVSLISEADDALLSAAEAYIPAETANDALMPMVHLLWHLEHPEQNPLPVPKIGP